MWKHIFKITWKERRLNAWALLELSVGFVVLWICVDYVYFVTQRLTEPWGKEFEHTYWVYLGVKPEAAEAFYAGDTEAVGKMLGTLWTIYDRMENHPAVEHIAMANGVRGNTYYKVDSVMKSVFSEWYVTPEYFDVFGMNFIKGRPFAGEEDLAGNKVIINGDYDHSFAGKDATYVDKITHINTGKEEETDFQVIGIVEPVKRFGYERYLEGVYHPLNKNNPQLIFDRSISIRVKPDADIDFAEKFSNDIREQASVEPFYFLGVNPIEKSNKLNLQQYRQYDETKSIYAISAFLIVNIFLGVMGTFWLRAQSRNSDIGLRRAIGASKASVRSLFLREGMLLLLIAGIVGIIICVNIILLDVLGVMGLPTSRDIHGSGIEAPVSAGQYFINSAITLLLLAIVVGISIWYPAKKASDIQPVEALRDE